MIIAVSTHHACAHGKGQAKLFRCLRICLPYFRMIGQTKIIIQAPNDHFLAAEYHAATDLALQFWKCKIAVSSFTMLLNISVVFEYFLKNVCHVSYRVLLQFSLCSAEGLKGFRQLSHFGLDHREFCAS